MSKPRANSKRTREDEDPKIGESPVTTKGPRTEPPFAIDLMVIHSIRGLPAGDGAVYVSVTTNDRVYRSVAGKPTGEGGFRFIQPMRVGQAQSIVVEVLRENEGKDTKLGSVVVPLYDKEARARWVPLSDEPKGPAIRLICPRGAELRGDYFIVNMETGMFLVCPPGSTTPAQSEFDTDGQFRVDADAGVWSVSSFMRTSALKYLRWTATSTQFDYVASLSNPSTSFTLTDTIVGSATWRLNAPNLYLSAPDASTITTSSTVTGWPEEWCFC